MRQNAASEGDTALFQPPVLLAPEQFERLRDMIAAYAGVYLDTTQRRVLEAGIVARIAQTGKSAGDYRRHLAGPLGRAELGRLAELMLNHETFFFRNPAQFEALRTTLLPELHARKRAGEPLRIWSAGCATGEEPYSIAIAALETLGHTGRPIEVYGTDLSERALQNARSGFYRGRSLASVTPAQLTRFFKPHADGYVVNETLRDVVRFVRHNLLDPIPMLLHGCDAIFCQNVTIYFQPAARRELMARFFASLPVGGFLLLGFSETLRNVFDGFRVREAAGSYVYYKGSQTFQVAHGTSQAAISQRPAVVRRRALPRQPWLHEDNQATTQITAARTLADRGELTAAAALLEAMLHENALNDEAYVLLGAIYNRQEFWPAATLVLERARYLRPNDPVVSLHLAEAYRQCGRAEHAAREYQVALHKLEPHPPDAVLEGAAVHWLRQTCEQQLALVGQNQH